MTLYIIAGHGAGDPGAGGAASDGKRYDEAERVRSLGRCIVERSGGQAVLLDPSRNWYADRGVNSALKQLVGNSPVTELHMDSAGAGARGGHVIIREGFEADRYDKALASSISKRFPGRSSTIVGRGNLANINRAAANGINYRLVEVCFISNKGDLDRFNAQIASIADDILRAFGITPKAAASKPKQVAGKAANDLGLCYRAHIQKAGTLPPVHDGQTAGSTGYGARMEGLLIDARKLAKRFPGITIDVKAHIQKLGDRSYKNVQHDTLIGTMGKSLRLEELTITAHGLPKGKRLEYRVHVAKKGWTGWVTSGKPAGTRGKSLSIEAVQMRIVDVE